MEHWINLKYPVTKNQLEKIHNFYEVMGDAIIYHITLHGYNLTNAAIRGEVYDLNTSIRMANELGGATSAPEIVVTDALAGKFTATCATGLTATMQKFAQVEFAVWDENGNKFTILQQAIQFNFERIIWQNESQGVYEDTGEDPLF